MQCKMAGSIITLALAILAVPLTSHAPPLAKVPRVGILIPYISDSAAYRAFHEAFGQGLHELGYVEGQNIVIEYRSAEGQINRLPNLAADLVRLAVDVLVTVSTPGALAAQNATRTLPIVFTAVGDPIGSGLVAGLAQPGGNITGFANIVFELAEKQLEMLKQAVPSASRMAVLWNPDFAPHVERLKALRIACQVLRVELQLVEFRELSDFEGAIAAASRDSAGALLIMGHALTFQHSSRLAELAARSRLPAISPYRPFAEAGGLIAYGERGAEGWRRAPTYVDKILKGAKPGDLPVQQVMRFELVINLKTAQAFGLIISPTLLFQADEVIQ